MVSTHLFEFTLSQANVVLVQLTLGLFGQGGGAYLERS